MGCAITGSEYRWWEGIIPYEIDSTDFPVGSANRQSVQNAINQWNNGTVLRLQVRQGQGSYAVFRSGTGCSSPVGCRGGQQSVNCDLASGGFGTTSVVHEIGHAAGLWHEHTREDRDSFIAVNHSNVDPSAAHNFERHVNDGDDIGPYDFASVMHYGPNAFSINPTQNTITAPQPIGQAVGLSPGDVAAIAFLYDKAGEFYAVEGGGSLSRLDRGVSGYRRTWRLIVSGEFGGSGGRDDLFFYDRAAGEGEFYRIDPGARNFMSRIHGAGGAAGEGEFYRIDPGARNFMNRIHGAGGFRRSWDVIVAGEFGGTGGKTDLFFYDRAAGEGEFYRIDPGARNFMNRIHGAAGFRRSWDVIVAGEFGGTGGKTDLFFYDRAAGEGEFYRIDPGARNFMNRLGGGAGFRDSWTAIVPGNFGRGPLADLFFYDSSA